MKQIRELGTGTKDARWYVANLLAHVTLLLGLYVFPALMVASAIILAILYLLVTIKWGLAALVVFFFLLIIARFILAKLVVRPHLHAFRDNPKLFSAVVFADKSLAVFAKFLGKLHVRHAQAVRYSTKWFWAQSLKFKAMVTVATVVILIPISFWVTVETVEKVAAKWPYGKNRYAMTPQQLAERKENRINTALYAVWGKENSAKSAECMSKYKDLIYSEASKNILTPERFEGLLFVESFCNEKIINQQSGAAGMGQIMLVVGCEEGLIMDKPFCAEVIRSHKDANIKRILFIPKDKKIEDRRLDAQYAIPAAAKFLRRWADYWGNEDWVFVQYHMGVGNLRKIIVRYLDDMHPGWDKEFPIDRSIIPDTITKSNPDGVMRIQVTDPSRSLPKALAKLQVSYDDIYFRSTPDKTPKAYKELHRLADSSATYVYTGLAAQRGLAMMRSDKKAFDQMIKAQFEPNGDVANRLMRVWWGDNDAKYKTLTDVVSATKQQELFLAPNNSNYGFVLRTSGASQIGECDLSNKDKYYVTKKATLGLMLMVFSRTKELGADTFEVTGLIRSHDMYDKPFNGKSGKGCLPQTQPRTHVIGSAFDIGINIKGKPMTAETRRVLEFVLMDLRADGVLDRIKEGTADHIAYNPAFERQLEEVYDQVMAGSSPLTVSK